MTPDFAPGTLIDGRYKLFSRLGSGGMADVYLAEDQQLGRKLALKLLHRRFAQDPGFVERFRREAQAAARLQHPNIVGVYDRGTFEDTSYIAMEYLPGRSLKQLIRDEAPLAPVRAIDITIQVLQAARFAHRHGVIHRDLKPHNVIVDDADQVKVTDFGIARAGASDMTETGSIMGTAQYLSPEQAQGHAVSAASDLYSVGVVLYELLTGRVPFDADSPVTIALKHVSEVPTAPTRFNPAIPPELEQVVMWALNKEAADRPQDADQLIDALERAKAVIESGRRGQATAAIPALAGVGAYRAAAATVPASAAPRHADMLVGDGDRGALPPDEPPPEDERRRSRWPWLLLLALALAIAAGVGAYLLSRPTRAVVPSVVGQNINNASTILQNDGFAVTTINVANPKPSGTVIHQSPQAGVKANEGSTVTLTVSTGPGNVNVPGVVNLSLAQAGKTLRAHGLTVGSVTRTHSDSISAGHVISSEPSAGTPVQGGSSIELIVSSGPANVSVPDVTGESEGDAKAQLGKNFNVTTSMQESSAVAAGTVISQDPQGGTSVPPGTTVHLVIAAAPTTASVPDVRGQTAASAASQLVQAGFQVHERAQAVTDQAKDGIVLSQDPAQGSTHKKGTTVTIVVGRYRPASTTPTPTTTTGTTTGTAATTTGTTPATG